MPTPPKKSATGALNTLRHSLSEGEWRDALHSAKTQQAQTHADNDQRAPEQTRHTAVRRCLLRVDRGDAAPGIYIVRSRDISSGGIRIIHGGTLKPDTVCCVIIESITGQSLVAGGTIAWSNPVKGTDTPAYELGIRFYQPIDAAPFAEQNDHTPDASDAAA
jgi:PilZ domain